MFIVIILSFITSVIFLILVYKIVHYTHLGRISGIIIAIICFKQWNNGSIIKYDSDEMIFLLKYLLDYIECTLEIFTWIFPLIGIWLVFSEIILILVDILPEEKEEEKAKEKPLSFIEKLILTIIFFIVGLGLTGIGLAPLAIGGITPMIVKMWSNGHI